MRDQSFPNEISGILSGLDALTTTTAATERFLELAPVLKNDLMSLLCKAVEFWLQLIQNPQEPLQNRVEAVFVLSKASGMVWESEENGFQWPENNSSSSNECLTYTAAMITRVLNEHGVTEQALSMAWELSEERSINIVLWLVAQLRSVAGVFEFLRKDSRKIAHGCALWTLGYPTLIQNATIQECNQILELICSYPVTCPKEQYRILRLFSSTLETKAFQQSALSDTSAAHALTYLNSCVAVCKEDRESWLAWLWSVSSVSRRSKSIESEQWKKAFHELAYTPYIAALQKYIDDEVIVRETASITLFNLGTITFLEIIVQWSRADPWPAKLIAEGLGTLAYHEDHNEVGPHLKAVYQTMEILLNFQNRSEADSYQVMVAVVSLASRCSDTAEMADESLAVLYFDLLSNILRSCDQKKHELIRYCASGLFTILIRNPNLVVRLKPILEEKILSKICVQFESDEYIVPCCVRLLLATNDFEKIMEFLNCIISSPASAVTGLHELLDKLDDHSEAWTADQLRLIGDFAKRTFRQETPENSKFRDSYLLAQSKCVNLLSIIEEKVLALDPHRGRMIDLPTLEAMCFFYHRICGDRYCNLEVLTGINKCFLSLEHEEKKRIGDEIPNAIKIFKETLSASFQTYLGPECPLGYDKYLDTEIRLAFLITDGVQLCFQGCKGDWRTIICALQAVETVVRSPTFQRSTQEPSQAGMKKEMIEAINVLMNEYGSYDCSFVGQCRTLLGLLG